MNTRIAEELENEALQRFHADFRRALLMHRKAALYLFFRLQFPLAEEPLYDGVCSVEDLDCVCWPTDPPSEPIREHPVYLELIARRSLNGRTRPCIVPSNPAATGSRWMTCVSLNKTEEECEKEVILKEGGFP